MESTAIVEPRSKCLPMTYSGYASGILAWPLQPSFCRICPACGKWFALRFQQARPHPVVEQIAAYRCRACGHAVEYAQGRPSGTL